MSIYDNACDYARDCGIPDDQIDDVVAKAELCCGDEVCVENTEALIESMAERFNDSDQVNELIANEKIYAEVTL